MTTTTKPIPNMDAIELEEHEQDLIGRLATMAEEAVQMAAESQRIARRWGHLGRGVADETLIQVADLISLAAERLDQAARKVAS